MEKVTTKKLALYSGRTHPELAASVADHLGLELGHPNIVEFANGELRPRFAESVRGNDVFILQSHYGVDGQSINDSIMEQLIMIDAAYRASAKRITAVCPFFGYARQDRKAEGREPITARLVADMFKVAGAKRMISIDLHAGQIQGFFDGPVDHLTAMPVLEAYLREHASAPVIVSPDAGRIKVAERMAQHLGDCGADLAFVYKRRPKGTANVAEATEVIGEVDGRLCVLTDDMIDTAGTITSAAELLVVTWGHRGVGDGHPRRALRPGHRPVEEQLDQPGRADRHAAAAVREAAADDRGPVDRPADRRGALGRVRRHQRQRHLRRRESRLSRPPQRRRMAERGRSLRSATLLWSLGVIAGSLLLFAAVETVLVVVGPVEPTWLILAFPVMGLLYGATGVEAWRRRPSNRIGLLLVLGAWCWLLAGLGGSQIREGAVGEDVGGDRAVQALDLALGLGVVGAAVARARPPGAAARPPRR